MRFAHQRWAIEQQYQELKTELGLDHFEGRTFPGWHHHVVLTAMTYNFLQAERQRQRVTVDVPGGPRHRAGNLHGVSVCSASALPETDRSPAVGSATEESAVIVRARDGWVDVLSALSGIPGDKCAGVLSDLTFDSRRSVDLHVHPMVQIDPANDLLAVAPPFPLHANHEENILRVCSQRRRQVFDAFSNGKEAEMLAAVRPSVARYYLQDSVGLPDQIRHRFDHRG